MWINTLWQKCKQTGYSVLNCRLCFFPQVNGSDFTNLSLPGNKHVRRPSRRVEVSPPPSPELPRSHITYNPRRFGMYTQDHSRSHWMGAMPGHEPGSSSFRRYAFSEAPWGTQLHTSTAGRPSFHRRSLRLTEGPQPVFADTGFQQSHRSVPGWSPNQTVFKQEKHTVQGPNGTGMFGALQPDNGLSWLAQVRRNGQGLHRQNSYSPSVISAEVNLGKTLEEDLPIEEIQAHNYMTV